MSKIAVIGATGTAGSRTAAKLKAADETVVEISRSTGVDIVSGDGLLAALEGVDVAIDASNDSERDRRVRCPAGPETGAPNDLWDR
jgi:nucleoside-diphosphate-sugar epimerase